MDKKLQVFVSSTYTDLIEERQAAVQAILDAGHIPAGMELFKAGNESQLKTIYKWIDESDVYMLILGGRYGSVEKKSGLSYTELEYKYALFKNIPVFAVVLSDSFLTLKINSLGLKNVTEQIAPDKYQTFKSLVMSKIIREVNDCKDIKLAVHSTLNEFINEYDLIGWVRNNYNNKIFTTLLEENKSLRLKTQQLQNQLNNFNSKKSHEYYNFLLETLKSCDFDYYNHSTINALYFFVINYDYINPGVSYPSDNLACPICLFLERFNLIKNTYSYKSKIIGFTLTPYGYNFYKYIQKEHFYILQYCNQNTTDYYGNKIFI